jgi:hypothetical protein
VRPFLALSTEPRRRGVPRSSSVRRSRKFVDPRSYAEGLSYVQNREVLWPGVPKNSIIPSEGVSLG